MAITLIAHIGVGTGSNGGTTSSINTTGANLIVVIVAYGGGLPSISVSDNKSNTYTARTSYLVAGSNNAVQLFDSVGATTGSGHTFTVSGGGGFESIYVEAFSGAASSSTFETQTGNNNGAGATTTLQAGSITPAQNGEVLIAGLANANGSANQSINGGFTITDQVPLSGGNYYGGAMAYLIQTTAAPANPTWTSIPGAQMMAVTLACYKAVAGKFLRLASLEGLSSSGSANFNSSLEGTGT